MGGDTVAAHAGLCQTWSETPSTGFLASRFIYNLRYDINDSQELASVILSALD